MRTFTYVIVPALSLLNIGVEAATIAQALTSKHSTGNLQIRKIVHDRQFHNADFGLDSGHVARTTPLENIMSNDLKTTVTGKDGQIATFQGNPAFADAITNVNGRRANELATGEDEIVHLSDIKTSDPPNPQTITDSSSTTVDADRISSEGNMLSDLGAGETSSTAGLLTSTVVDSVEGGTGPLISAATPPVAGTLPSVQPLLTSGDAVSALDPAVAGLVPLLSGVTVGGTVRRQVNETADGDGAEEVATEELESMSTSLDDVSALKSSKVIPDSVERRMIKVLREDGSISASFGGEPVVDQNVPVPLADKLTQRGVDVSLPVALPRGVASGSRSPLKRQLDITDLGLGAADDAVDHSSTVDLD